ncbi:protein SLX4IP [Osmerus mordax]|uniref:protein SLX4IP n=1 Tax=Osmerus mordax TaxID=8014 RepID=UPI00350FE4B8
MGRESRTQIPICIPLRTRSCFCLVGDFVKRHSRLRCVVKERYGELRVFPERYVVCASRPEEAKTFRGNPSQAATEPIEQSRSEYFSRPGETQALLNKPGKLALGQSPVGLLRENRDQPLEIRERRDQPLESRERRNQALEIREWRDQALEIREWRDQALEIREWRDQPLVSRERRDQALEIREWRDQALEGIDPDSPVRSSEVWKSGAWQRWSSPGTPSQTKGRPGKLARSRGNTVVSQCLHTPNPAGVRGANPAPLEEPLACREPRERAPKPLQTPPHRSLERKYTRPNSPQGCPSTSLSLRPPLPQAGAPSLAIPAPQRPETTLEVELLTPGKQARRLPLTSNNTEQTNQNRLATSLRGLSVKPASSTSSISSRSTGGGEGRGGGGEPGTWRLRRQRRP